MATESTAAGLPPSADPLAGPRRQALISIFGERFANSYMGPIHFIDEASLHSPTAINFFKRDFQYISRVLSYEYQYRSWNGFNQELLDRYAEIINKKITNINTLLDNWCKRFQKLMEQNGVKMDSAVYPNSITTSVPVISGFARSYFLILQELDRLNLLAGSANLMGVIDSHTRAQAEFTCKKAIRAFAAALRNEVVLLYREADRLIKSQKGQGEANAVQQEAVAQHGQELADFGKVIENDGKTDTGLNLGSDDPGKVIDDAAAATTAASKAAAKPRKTAAPKGEGQPAEPAPAAN